MIVSTSLVMASVMATMVQALPNRIFARQGNTTSPDRSDLTNLKPVDWHNLLQGSYGGLPLFTRLIIRADLQTHTFSSYSKT